MNRLAVLAILAASGFCLASAVPSTRVIGGQDALNGAYPYIVSLRSVENDGFFCGGSILNRRWVLTAAHCVITWAPEQFYIGAGENNLQKQTDKYQVVTVTYNKNFTFDRTGNDTAVVEVNRDFDFSNPNIQAVKLYQGFVPDRVKVKAIGWGVSNPNSPSATVDLQELTMFTLSHNECREHLSYVKTKEICVYNTESSGVCIGDSGSPLIIDGSNYQVGIASWVRTCAGGYPDVYTRVGPYLGWIKENTNAW